MIGSLVHRGPEGQTCWLSPDRTLALAYAQLSFFKGAKALGFYPRSRISRTMRITEIAKAVAFLAAGLLIAIFMQSLASWLLG